MGRYWPPLCGPAGLCMWTSSAAEDPEMCSLVTTDAVHSQGPLRDSQQLALGLRHATQRRRGIHSGAPPAAGFRGKPRLRRASAVLARYPLNRRNGAVPSGKGNKFVYSALRWRSLDDALHVYNAFLHMAQGGFNSGRRAGPWPGLSKVSARSSNCNGRIQAKLARSRGWLVDYTAGARLGASHEMRLQFRASLSSILYTTGIALMIP